MPLEPYVREGLLAAVPSLRAFACTLSGNQDRADDLVQDTLAKAIDHIDSFEPGTNIRAWLFTILRNSFLTECRKRKREVEDGDGSYAESLVSLPDQVSRIEFHELSKALAKLTRQQHDAVILVGASSFSYEEAAAICGCAVGTIKSRVNRARHRLAELLGMDAPNPAIPSKQLALKMQRSSGTFPWTGRGAKWPSVQTDHREMSGG